MTPIKGTVEIKFSADKEDPRWGGPSAVAYMVYEFAMRKLAEHGGVAPMAMAALQSIKEGNIPDNIGAIVDHPDTQEFTFTFDCILPRHNIAKFEDDADVQFVLKNHQDQRSYQ